MMLILNVLYVLLAIAMIALILLQRGAGAQAGSGFGAGASATVFGSRGASNFMTQATKWLAVLFFGISLYMAWYATHSSKQTATPAKEDASLMSDVGAKPAEKTPPTPVPQAIPQAPSQVPVAPTQTLPVPAAPTPATPAPQPTPAPSAPTKAG